MAVALNKENFALHKLHSLTGIIPVGYYLAQHLLLNTFSLAGRDKFNGVIGFFESMPVHFLYALKFFSIWLPLIFHAVYGLFIVARAKYNYGEKAYSFRENRYFSFQRWSGIGAFLFLIYHMASTSVMGTLQGPAVIQYDSWAARLSSGGTYLILVVYLLGVALCTYHLSYGIWSFCIRWGITISEKAQNSVWKLAGASFVLLTLMGWAALAGFFYSPFKPAEEHSASISTASPATPISYSR